MKTLLGAIAVLGAIATLPVGASAAPGDLTARGLADRAGLRLGTAAQSYHLDDAGYRGVIRRQVNTITFENEAKWEVIHPGRSRYDFSKADRLARWAQHRGMKMRGHTLIWHVQNPGWLKGLDPSREEAIEILRDHITTVVRHFRRKFPGLVTQWDVVNEAIDNDGTRRSNVWQRWIGDGYVAMAFRFARRAAGPKVKLFLNDYFDNDLMAAVEAIGGEFDDGDAAPSTTPGARGSVPCEQVVKCAATRALVKDLLAGNVPIDGVGFQAHMLGVDPADYRALTAWVGKLGLEWAITEADVPMLPDPDSGTLRRQAHAFATALRSCVDDPACGTFVTWGLSDRYTWWRGLAGGVFPDALPFDQDLAPNPAVPAMDAVLAEAPRAPCRRRRFVDFRFHLTQRSKLRRASATVNGLRSRTRRVRGGRVRVSLARSTGADATVLMRARIAGPRSVRTPGRAREVHLCPRS